VSDLGNIMNIWDFLKEQNIGIALVISSVVFPLMVHYVKQRWDRSYWQQRIRADEIRNKQSKILDKKVEILDSLNSLFATFAVEARFIIVDADLGRLATDLGIRHRESYDEYARSFFRDILVIEFKTEQYFNRGKEYSERLRDNSCWHQVVDRALTQLVDETISVSEKKGSEKVDNRWYELDNTILQIRSGVIETLNQMSNELKPDYEFSGGEETIKWETTVNVSTNSLLNKNTEIVETETR
jgi:hypothetical protein